MKSQIFLNIPVSNLEQSAALYTAMGFTKNENFSDPNANCMIWSEEIFVMLLTQERFASFTNKPIADTKTNIAALHALSVESLDKVHQICDAALAAGATEPKPLQDHGFMQLRTIEDFDGHTWEVFYMDASKMGE